MAVSPGVKAASTPNPDDMQFTGDTSDPRSPTTLIMNAMKQAGVPLNAGNIRRFIEARGRNTDVAGPDAIPGAEGDAPLRYASPDKGPSVGQRGSSAKAVEGKQGTGAGESSRGGSGDTPPKPSGYGAVDRHDEASATNAQPTTSAPPQDASTIALSILGPLAYGMANAYTGYKQMGMPDAPRPYPTVEQASEPRGFVMEDTPPLYGNMRQTPQLGEAAGPMPDPGAGVPTPLENPMLKAIEGPRLGLPAPPAGPPGTVLSQGPAGMEIPGVPATAPQVAPPPETPPTMPFRQSRVGAPPNINQPTFADIAKQALRMYGGRR